MNYIQLNRILELFQDALDAAKNENISFPNNHSKEEYKYQMGIDRLSFLKDDLEINENDLNEYDEDILYILKEIIEEEKNK